MWERIDLRLTTEQTVQVLRISSHLSSLAQRERYGNLRALLATPSEGGGEAAESDGAVSEGAVTAAAWWRYAVACVNRDLEAQRRRLSS